MSADLFASEAEVLTVQRVAELTNSSVSSVRHWIRSGRLKSVRFGRRRQVLRAELRRFVLGEAERDAEPWARLFDRQA